MPQALGSIFSGGSQGGLWSEAIPGMGSTGGSSGGGWMSKVLPLILAGSGIAGTVGNVQANAARNKVLSSEMAQMEALTKLTPSQIASGIASLQAPLSKNLTNSVSNSVQGELANRGLSQAPGIYASSLAQGIAPYQLQEQQLAQDAYFKKLGLPIQARPSPFGPFPNTTNTSQIWQQLMQRYMGQGGGKQQMDTTGVASPVPGLVSDMIAQNSGLTTQPAQLPDYYGGS